MTIESISWQRVEPASGDSAAAFPGFELHMGLCPDDYLGTDFLDNYIPGTRTLVYSSDVLEVTGSPGSWYAIDLQTPFWYDGQENLLIELCWTGATGSFHTFAWNSPGVPRSLKAPTPDGATGFLSSMMSEIMLEGTAGLTPSTFARVKILAGSPPGR